MFCALHLRPCSVDDADRPNEEHTPDKNDANNNQEINEQKKEELWTHRSFSDSWTAVAGLFPDSPCPIAVTNSVIIAFPL
jgi:hypothetical protein